MAGPPREAQEQTLGGQVGLFESGGYHRGLPSQRGPSSQGAQDQAWEEQVGLFESGGYPRGRPPQRGPSFLGAQEQAWEGQVDLITWAFFVPGLTLS